MDLSSIDGLTEEQIAAITAAHNSDVEGLKNKNTELLSEKEKRAAEIEEQQRIAKDAQAAAAKAAEEKLKAEGDFDGYKKSYEERMANEKAELAAKLEAKDAMILGSRKEAELAKAMSLIADNYKFGIDDKLNNVIQVGYNDETGKPEALYIVAGEVVAKSADEFGGWAAKQEQWAGVLKGVDSGGAGVVQSNDYSKTKTFADMNATELAILANKNPAEYARLTKS